MSELGGYIIHGLHGVGSQEKDGIPAMSGPRLAAAANQPLRDPHRSDLMMCILKLLLARSAHEAPSWFNARSSSFTTTSSLAAMLGISASAAYGIISDLHSRNWVVVEKKHGPMLVKPHDVAEWWLNVAKVSRYPRRALRPFYPHARLRDPTDRLEWLRQRGDLPGCHWAVNGWTACDLHRQSFLLNSAPKPCTIALVGSIAHLA